MRGNCDQYEFYYKNSTSFKTVNSSCSWANILLACPTTLSNLLLIVSLAISGERNKPCAVLILNLAVTDFLNGVINMPLYYIIFRYIAQDRDPCVYLEFSIPGFVAVSFESFLTVILIAVERYINVFHPFLYNSKLSTRNVAVYVGISWVLSILVTVLMVTGENGPKFKSFFLTFGVVGVILTSYCYVRLLHKARKIRLQIRNETARFDETIISSEDRRYVLVGGLIIISMAVCFSVQMSSILLWLFKYRANAIMNRCWGWTLIMANSLVNPIITCRFCPTIRRSLLRIVTCSVLCKESNQ